MACVWSIAIAQPLLRFVRNRIPFPSDPNCPQARAFVAATPLWMSFLWAFWLWDNRYTHSHCLGDSTAIAIWLL